jgi:hypothetical protein
MFEDKFTKYSYRYLDKGTKLILRWDNLSHLIDKETQT